MAFCTLSDDEETDGDDPALWAKGATGAPAGRFTPLDGVRDLSRGVPVPMMAPGLPKGLCVMVEVLEVAWCSNDFALLLRVSRLGDIYVTSGEGKRRRAAALAAFGGEVEYV